MEKIPLLEVKNLVTSFKTENATSIAVNDISFKLSKGETIGIVGESGSGKSVTSLSIMKLIAYPAGKISSGEIIFHSPNHGATDLTKLAEYEMRKIRGNEISMIFQEPMTSLNPVFTCGNQVMEAIMLHQNLNLKQAKEKTIELFKEVQLPRPNDIFNSYPHQISGGQKQRVMIAMALSCEPSLLIADEPTTALDVTVQKTILDLILKIQKQRQMGLIFITHDLGVIAELADQIVVMYKGKIVEQGPVLEIFTQPKHPYTKGLLACRPPLEKRLTTLPTISDFMEIDEHGNIKEIAQSVEGVLSGYEIADQERKKLQKKIYGKSPILEVKNLKTYFPTEKGLFQKTKTYVKAVDDVSLEVYPGETLGLVGESGCGKTTLGRTILKLIEPSAGNIFFQVI
jgi:peptide/nickel transport system ATP-binding protein